MLVRQKILKCIEVGREPRLDAEVFAGLDNNMDKKEQGTKLVGRGHARYLAEVLQTDIDARLGMSPREGHSSARFTV